jgi:hypothetical protein
MALDSGLIRGQAGHTFNPAYCAHCVGKPDALMIWIGVAIRLTA